MRAGGQQNPLACFLNQSHECRDRGRAAEGETTMTTFPTEAETMPAVATASQEQTPEKKPKAAPRKPHVASAKGRAGKKATPAKKAPKAQKAVKAAKITKAPTSEIKPGAARQGSKTAQVLELLQRPDGATLRELMRATGWQPHSVRGFISGTLGKNMGLTVTSLKGEDGERSYSLSK